MNKRHSHSSSIRIALETRMMFDGAAVVTAEAAAAAPAAVDAHAAAPADAHSTAPADGTHTDPTLAATGEHATTHSSDAPPAADASHAPADQHHNDPTDALHDALTATAPVDLAPARHEIFFVDSSLPDLNTLVASLPAHADIVYLDSNSDGVAQIANALEGRENIDAIHLITHATEGSVVVGASVLNTASIEGQYHEMLAEIGSHMSATGDVLIYGCDFAAGTDGTATVLSLAQALNADVAASTNTTGVDGDWILEDHVGKIETTAIHANDWHHDLLLTSPDSATVYYGSGTVINVLANDGLGGLLQSMTISSQPARGTAVLNANNTITYTPTAGSTYTGTDTFQYQVKVAGVLLPETQTVTVFLDHPPTITAPVLVNGTEDTGLTLSGSNAIVIADSDVSQTTTTVTLSVPTGTLALVSAAGLSFSQGSVSGSSTLTFSGSITAVNAALNGLVYTPLADANSTSGAPINLTVTAVDPSNGTTISNVGLVLAPVADIVADAVTTKQSTPASFNVLSNDNFENAGRLVTGYSTPAHGTVTIDAQGNAVYTPTVGFAGTDTFTYTVTSGGSTETATVTVTTLLNYAPTITVPASQTFNEDTTRVFSSVNGNAISVADANNDILTVTLAATKGALTLAQTAGLTFTSGDGVADASMVIRGTAAAINAALNGLQFIPVADYNGTANISVQASDGIASVQTTNVALTLTPVADGVADSVSTSILTAVTFSPLANDNFEGTPSITSISAPANGIAVLAGNSITYTPALGYAGTDTFTYTVTSGGVTETIPITVTVGDAAPTGPATLGTLNTVDKGVVLINVGLQFSDADLLDVLRFTATGLPAGLTIDPLLGTITGIVDGHASVNGVGGTGTYNVVVTATDLAGKSFSSSASIVVTNPAPIPLLGLSVGGTENALLGIGANLLAIVDPDGDAFSITNATALHGTVTINNDGSLSYQPNANYYGADVITYIVKDVDGGQATGSVAVLLAAVPHLPVLSLPSIPLLLEDTPLIFANLLGQQISVGNIDGDAVTIDLALPLGVGALSIANLSNHTGVSLTQTSDTLGTHLKLSGLSADVNAALNDLIYTPAADYNGPLNITIGLGKLLGGILNVNATLPIGIAAVADIVDDNVTTTLNTPATFNVLANDTFENAGRVVTSFTTPLHGTVTIDAQGNAVYTPTNGYLGSDSFTYTVTSNGTVETATVHINAILPNYAPVISAPTAVTIAEDATQIFSSANGNAVTVSDQNNDILTVTLSTNHGNLTLQQTTGLTFTSGDGNTDASMTFSGSSAAINAALNGLRFAPTADYNGSATISLQAGDGIAAVQTSSIALTITAVDDGVADNIQTGPLAPVTFLPLANDTFEGTPTITGITQGAHGAVVLGLNGAVTYTPALGYLGSDSFTYTVTSGGVTETVAVNVVVGNHVPVSNGNLGTVPLLDGQLTVALSTAQAFSDSDVLDVLRYTATNLPAGLTIDPLTGLISGQVNTHASVNGLNASGTYNIVVTATDLAGTSATSNLVIQVTNPAPIPLLGLQVTGNEDTPIDITAAALAVIDPDGDTLTVTGATAQHGTVTINNDGSLRYTPNANYNGIDTITYQVRDADGATATGYVAVVVVPVIDLPTIQVPSLPLLAEDTPLIFANIVGQHLSVGNVDGDLVDLRISVPLGLLSITNTTGISISEGSSTGSTVLHFSGTAAAVNGALNSLIYTPGADYNGPLNINLALGHLTGGILNVNVDLPITIVPVADIVNDNVTTQTNTTVGFNVLANDTFENTTPTQGRVVDSFTNPLHGTVTIDAQGNAVYTPTTGFTGTDTFTYTVKSNGTYETATVTIAINAAPNANPTGTSIANQAGTDGQPVSIDVHGYFADADNDGLTYSATGLPAGVTINAGTGVISGNLGIHASTATTSGAYAIVVTASDGKGGVVSESFTLNVVNPAPAGVADAFSGTQGSPVSGNVLTNDTDPDGDTLSVSTTPVQGPANGILVLNSNGTFVYTPNASFHGTDTFQYQVIDADGGTSTATVTLTIAAVNSAPVNSGVIGTQIGNDSTTVNLNVAGQFSDADGDTLTYSATGLPPGLTMSPTGLITGTLGSSASQGGTNGTYAVTVSAADGRGGLTTQVFNFNVVNPAPTTANSTATTPEDTAVTGTLAANDVDGDSLTFSAVTQPSHGTLSLNAITGAYTYTPAANYNGSDSFTYKVVDADGGVATATVNLTVTAVNDAPVGVGSIGAQSGVDAAPFSLSVANRFADVDGDTLSYSASGLPAGLSINAAGVITGNLDSSASRGGNAGLYTVAITAIDGNGASVVQSFTLNVSNPTPVTANSSNTTAEDVPVTGTLLATDDDVVTFTTATGPSHGTLVLNGSTGFYTYTPAANYNGSDSFTYTVTDADGATTTATVSLTIVAVNDAPTAPGTIGAQTGTDNTAFNLGVADRFNDVDGDSLSFSAIGLPAGLSIDAAGQITGTLGSSASRGGPDGNGTYSVVITANDGHGATVAQSFVLTVANPAPTAVNSSLTLSEDTVATGNLLTNASDIDGDILRLDTTPVVGPAHGVLTLNANGTYLYTPAANYNGSDSFTYRVIDADGSSVTATVAITINAVNDVPVTNGIISAQAGNDSTAFSLNVAGNFSDVDSPLTYSVTGLPEGLTLDPSTGLISGTLASSASTGGSNGAGGPGGIYSVVITASDGIASAAQTFTFTVSNPPPTANDSTVIVAEDATVSGNLLANAQDPDGDVLRIDTTLVSAPLHGSLTLNTNGVYTYTPAANFNGTDSFTYRVVDADGASAIATISFNVTPVYDAPMANGSVAAITANDHSTLTVNVAGAFSNIDNNPLSYSAIGLPAGLTIDAGTGLISGTLDSSASAQGPGGHGIYTVQVSASDGMGGIAIQSFTLTALNTLPTATNGTVTVAEDTVATGSLLANASDADLDTLAFVATSQPTHGTLVLNPNGSYTYTPAANYNGSDSFNYRVTDADGASTTATLTFNVSPVYDGPTAGAPLANITANDHSTVSLDVSGNFNNVDNAPLTYSVSALPNGLSFNTATGVISGTLDSRASTQGSDGNGGPGGSYFITVTATDPSGGSASQIFTLTAVNTLPVAGNATVTLAEDTAYTGTLLNNTVDADLDTLSFVATSQPTHGSLTLNANGTYTYTPVGDYHGTDSFNYRVTDADGAISTATITFTVTPVYDAPTPGIAVAAQAANDHSSISLGVAGNFNNPDNAALSYSATGLPVGLTINATTGVISGTLGSSASTQGIGNTGNYSITVSASDNFGGVAAQTFAFTAINTLPVATNATVSLAEDTSAVIDLRTTASDADQDALSFAITGAPTHGSLVLNANGTYTYTPIANYNGNDTFTYSVTDADGAITTAVITLNVTPVYDAPVGTPIATQTGNDSSLVSLNVAGNFSDADNRALSYSATGLPVGLSINATTGLITGTLGSSASTLGLNGTGNYSVTINANDGIGGIASQTFIFTAVNTLPVASNATVSVAEDTSASINLNAIATDADNDNLTFAITTGPAHGTLTQTANGTYTYTPAGNYNGSDSFTYRVTDADDAVTSAVVTLNVTPVYDAPVPNGTLPPLTANDSSAVNVNVAGSFADADNRALTYTATGLPAGLTLNASTGLLSGNLGSSASAQGINGTGQYTVVVTANDGLGGTVAQAFTLTAVNTLPTANGASLTLAEDTSTVINLNALASDADNDGLTFVITQGPAHGTLTLNSAGNYTFVPTANFNGSDSITYQVTDADGAVSSATIALTITPVYDGPAAVGQIGAQQVNDAGAVNLAVANRFADADGATLTYSATGLPAGVTIDANSGLITGLVGSSASRQGNDGNGGVGGNYDVVITASDGTSTITQSFTLTAVNTVPVAVAATIALGEDTPSTGNLTNYATDADRDTLTFAIDTPPAHGSLAFNSNGVFTYTPALNYVGTDSFTYTVNDPDGGSSTSVVNFTVIADTGGPVANGTINTQVANDHSNIRVDVTGNFTISSGAALTYSATGLPAGLTIDPATGLIIGQLDSSASRQGSDGNGGPGGNYTVVITATDTANQTASQSFILTAVNTVPVANSATLNLNEDGVATGDLHTFASDADADVLSFTVAQAPAHGTLTLNLDGTYTYTPSANFNGTDSFIYQVSDPDGGFSSSTLVTIVAPVYDGPVAVGTLPSLSANDHSNVSINTGAAFNDPDGTPMTYSVTGLPSGLTLDVNTGLITGTLDSRASTQGANGTGLYTVVVTASDGGTGIASQTFTLTAVNTLPVANNTTVTLVEDTSTAINLNTVTSDADLDTLTFAITTGPSHGSLVADINNPGTYVYTPNANYNGADSFSYRVTDADGAVSNAVISFNVTPVYDAPLTGAPLNAVTANDHSSVSINVIASFSSPDNLPLTYTATGLPNGITLDPVTGLLSGTLDSRASTEGSDGLGGAPGTGGNYVIRVTANDGTSSVFQEFTLTAVNTVPVASASNVTLAEDGSYTGDLRGSAADADLDVLSFAVTAAPAHGTLTLDGVTGLYTYTPVGNYNGNDSFSYRVSDQDGGSSIATVTFTVTPGYDAPVGNGTIAAQSANDGASLNLNVAGNFTNVDNLPLTYSATGLPAGVTINAATGLISGQLGSSASALSSNGAAAGQYEIVVSASDGTSTASQAFTLTAINTVPTATNATVVLAEDSVFNGNLAGIASDTDGDVLTFSATTQPLHGVLTVNADGTYRYTPAANFNGTDSFTYTVTDADQASRTATVTFTVTPGYDAPAATAPFSNVTANDHTSINVNVAANFTSIDNLPLTYTATGLPNGITLDPTTGLLSGTLNSRASTEGIDGLGDYVIRVSASDGITTVAQDLILTAVNTLPVAANASVTLAEDASYAGDLRNNVSDADQDTLSFVVNTGPAHGSLTFAANGTYTYTPAANYNGANSFTYTVTDADGAISSATVNLTITAQYDAPSAGTPVAAISANDHSSLNFSVAGNFNNVDNTGLTYTASGLPSGLSIDANTGLITGTLSSSASRQGSDGNGGAPGTGGQYAVTVSVNDGQGGIASQSFNLTAVNTLPTAGNATLTLPANSNVSANLLNYAQDTDGDVLSFVATVAPTHGTLVLNADGSFTYTPTPGYAGTDTLTYTVTDADNASTTATLTFNVAAALAPNGSIAPISANDQTGVNLDISGNFSNALGTTLTYTATGLPTGITLDLNTGIISGTLDSSASTQAPGGGGSYTVIITASDGAGGTAIQVLNLTAVNTLPVASNASVTVAEDNPVAIDLTTIATDADNDALTFAITSGPAHGSLSLSANGVYLYTPAANYNGADSFSYQVTDADGAVSTATIAINVTPVADAPSVVAAIGTQTANDRGSVSLNVAGNFTSVDNLPLTYSATGLPAGLSLDPSTGLITGTLNSSASTQGSNGLGGAGGNYDVQITASDGTASVSQSFTLTAINVLPTASNAMVTVQQGVDLNGNLAVYASDPDGDALSFSVGTSPAHGSLTIGQNGSYVYSATPGYTGPDSFTYQVTDADGGVTLATININVSAQPDRAPVFTPLPTQTATDGGTFNLNLANSFTDPDNDTLTYSVSGLPSGLTLNPLTGQITGTLGNNASSQAPNGVYTLTLTASDGSVSVSQQVDLIVANPAPVSAGAAYSLPEDTSISGVLVASDPDGDSFVFAIGQGPGNGSLTLNANGSFTYVPNANFSGTDSFTYQVRDSDGGVTSAVVTFTVTPVNDAPVGTPTDPVVVPPGGPTVIDVLPGVRDPDGDPLTVVGGSADHGSVVVNPNGSLTYTPVAGYTGADTVTYTVSDGRGGLLTSTLPLSVSGAATTPPTTSTQEGFIGMASTQRITDGLGGIPPSYTAPGQDTYLRVTHYDPVLLDAINGVKRLGGLTTLSEDRPMQEVLTSLQTLAPSTEITDGAAPMAQAIGDLQEQNRQQLDVDDMRANVPGAVQSAPPEAPTAETPAAPLPAPVPGVDAGAANPQASVTYVPQTLNEQLQAASQARIAERDALAQLLAS